MAEEGVYVHIYKQKWGPQESYVLGVVDGTVTDEMPRGTLEELAVRLLEMAGPGFQGAIPINWQVPASIRGASPPKMIVPIPEREALAKAMPQGVNVNLN